MKTIKLLTILSILFIAVSCDKNEGEPVDKSTAVKEELPVNIADLNGTYRYKSVIAEKAIDLDGDGTPNKDLFKEKGLACVWDNIIQFKGNSMIILPRGKPCDKDEGNIIEEVTYSIDPKRKSVIILNYNDDSTNKLKNVKLYINTNNDIILEFDDYDTQHQTNIRMTFIKI